RDGDQHGPNARKSQGQYEAKGDRGPPNYIAVSRRTALMYLSVAFDMVM
ncbi:hypothetical protein PIIN_08388, partial [Serendipita indica DSM 11827]